MRDLLPDREGGWPITTTISLSPAIVLDSPLSGDTRHEHAALLGGREEVDAVHEDPLCRRCRRLRCSAEAAAVLLHVHPSFVVIRRNDGESLLGSDTYRGIRCCWNPWAIIRPLTIVSTIRGDDGRAGVHINRAMRSTSVHGRGRTAGTTVSFVSMLMTPAIAGVHADISNQMVLMGGRSAKSKCNERCFGSELYGMARFRRLCSTRLTSSPARRCHWLVCDHCVV